MAQFINHSLQCVQKYPSNYSSVTDVKLIPQQRKVIKALLCYSKHFQQICRARNDIRKHFDGTELTVVVPFKSISRSVSWLSINWLLTDCLDESVSSYILVVLVCRHILSLTSLCNFGWTFYRVSWILQSYWQSFIYLKSF